VLTVGRRSSLAAKDEDGCTCQNHTKEPLLCSYRTPMMLEDISCYSSPLHPISRQHQQLWLDMEPTSFSAQQLHTGLDSSQSIRQVACYAGDTPSARATDTTTKCPATVNESRYCSGDCPGSPCAVCRLLCDDVAPSSEYLQNIRQCKLIRQVATPSATPCDTPQHNLDAID